MAGRVPKPKSYSLSPGHFGRVLFLSWKRAPEAAVAARIASAQVQHFYAVRIRTMIHEKAGYTILDYARDTQTSYDRVVKVLRGDLVMRLEDITMADLVLGEVSELARGELWRMSQEKEAGERDPESSLTRNRDNGYTVDAQRRYRDWLRATTLRGSF